MRSVNSAGKGGAIATPSQVVQSTRNSNSHNFNDSKVAALKRSFTQQQIPQGSMTPGSLAKAKSRSRQQQAKVLSNLEQDFCKQISNFRHKTAKQRDLNDKLDREISTAEDAFNARFAHVGDKQRRYTMLTLEQRLVEMEAEAAAMDKERAELDKRLGSIMAANGVTSLSGPASLQNDEDNYVAALVRMKTAAILKRKEQERVRALEHKAFGFDVAEEDAEFC
mgnify:CR=1 FL=1